MPEERKLVTVLFIDVVGSTSMGEENDPEVVRAVLARYFEHMRAIAEAHGGTVEKFIGDAVMAGFGGPPPPHGQAWRGRPAAPPPARGSGGPDAGPSRTRRDPH